MALVVVAFEGAVAFQAVAVFVEAVVVELVVAAVLVVALVVALARAKHQPPSYQYQYLLAGLLALVTHYQYYSD